MIGEVGILNVGAGDIKISFNSENLQETIRARRIVKDMLKRGYALLVEVERNGEKAYERALDFNEKTNEYIVADYDPEQLNEQTTTHEQTEEIGKKRTPASTKKNKNTGDSRRNTRAIPANKTKAVAVGRSAGG